MTSCCDPKSPGSAVNRLEAARRMLAKNHLRAVDALAAKHGGKECETRYSDLARVAPGARALRSCVGSTFRSPGLFHVEQRGLAR